MSDYLNWRSKITLEQVFSAEDSVAYPSYWGDSIVFLSSLVAEESRSVLKLMPKISGQKEYSAPLVITPKPFSLRTKINEYGGKPFWIFGDELVFANQVDQCLYSQRIDSAQVSDPVRITIEPSAKEQYFYSDVTAIDDDHYICIVERNEIGGDAAENECFIGLIDKNNPDIPPKRLVVGADFTVIWC